MDIKDAFIEIVLNNLQKEMDVWQQTNFGPQPPLYLLMGIMEEVGELSHANLKGIQNIRYTPEKVRELKGDSVADIFIYLLNYCSAEKIDFGKELVKAWTKVSKRDWANNPMDAHLSEEV